METLVEITKHGKMFVIEDDDSALLAHFSDAFLTLKEGETKSSKFFQQNYRQAYLQLFVCCTKCTFTISTCTKIWCAKSICTKSTCTESTYSTPIHKNSICTKSTYKVCTVIRLCTHTK